MKKLFHLSFILSSALLLASCFGNAGKELPVKFGSERGELAGKPASLKQVIIDYEDVAPGRKGKTLSEDYSTYDTDKNILTYEIKYYDSDYEDYKQIFEYDDKGRMTKYYYEDSDDEVYSTVYTYKGDLITKSQNYADDEPTTYYKYTYKGNKETSRSLYNSIGVKLMQTDYTWDGDKVVKEVKTEEGETTIRTIEYPDDNTEIITIRYVAGEEEDDIDDIYIYTVKYDDNGNFATMDWIYNGETTNRVYSYEYDNVGNWTKRTVARPDGSLLWIETREFTYHD